MYLRSKPYRRKRRMISVRSILFWLIVPPLIVGGVYLYQNRETYQPLVNDAIHSVMQQAEQTVATIQAPPVEPTEDPSNTIRLADAAWRSGAIQESVRLYQDAIDALPNDLVAHYRLTYGLIQQGLYEEAAKAAENTVTANPFSPDAWAIRALALNRVGRYGDSLASALRALELDSENVRARAFLAQSYADIGNTDRARSEIERALAIDPANVEARYINGQLKWNVDYAFEEAVAELTQAYESSGLTYIGVALSEMYFSSFINQPQEGLAVLNDILARNPENTAVLYQLGRYYFRTLGDANQAIPILTRCINADPQSIACHYELGRAQERLERRDEARLSFERAVELGTQNPYHFWWAGEMELAVLGDCTAAMRYFEQGYAILLADLEQGIERFNTLDGLRTLRQNYDDSMTPCTAFNPLPITDPNAETTAEPSIESGVAQPTPDPNANQ